MSPVIYRGNRDPNGTAQVTKQVDDLLACLYGLHAVLRLHFVQEEENYFALDPDITAPHSRSAADR